MESKNVHACDAAFISQVGSPTTTAYMINDRGNRIYLKYEPHQPTIFPVTETRLIRMFFLTLYN